MRLSFIGMSGSGKSHWALRLAQYGFRRFCCDELIAKKLAPELKRPGGGVMELGEWMGLPYEPRYRKCESRYLACEIEVLMEILRDLEGPENNSEESVVVDTTGSAIYTGEEILRNLGRYTRVVHLATPPEIQEQMLEAYLANQRPVLWRDMFTKEPNETNEQALARCFPRLLRTRERLYERYADVTVDYYRIKEHGFGVRDLLHEVYSCTDYQSRGPSNRGEYGETRGKKQGA